MIIIIVIFSFQLVLEEDGTDVDDFDSIAYLSSLSKGAINLMILSEDESWQPVKDVNFEENRTSSNCKYIKSLKYHFYYYEID